MSARILLVFAILAIIVVFVFVGRNLYLRSQRLRRQLQMSNIFTNITHELLTPLTVISASVDKLRDKAPRHSRDYDLMQLNIQRMVRLLQQILETSKSEAGQLKLLVAQGDVMRYIRQTAKCLEPLLVHKHQHFTITCEPKSMMGWIDTDKLDKIIYNLLSNAAKYSNKDGMVSLKVQTNKTFDHIRIEVSDTGNGIPPEKMKHLFQRFHDGEYRKYQTIGTGLGLYLTHDLIFLHHGTISCQSEVGKGTTFIVELPINKEAFKPDEIDENRTIDFNIPQNAIIDVQALVPDVNENDDDPQEHPDEDIYRLLIVEDNVELLMLMRQLLKTSYRVYAAKNGREALNIVYQKDLDLIISDVMMPEMDGYELTKAIKDDPNYNHLPIILLTAKTQEEDEQQALLLGADEYLTKPFRLSDLKLRIDNIIENRKRIQSEYHLETADEARRIVVAPKSPDEEFLSRALGCVFSHLDDDTYDRDALAADMGASSSTIYNKLRSITGLNVSSFIRDIRLKEARRMAQTDPTLRVSDLAYKVGFRDPRYFSTCFKKQFGMQPKEFMESLYQRGKEVRGER
jgi:CheY-like chemotaxis protein/nitrogen-specific signal transduction histidine kinase